MKVPFILIGLVFLAIVGSLYLYSVRDAQVVRTDVRLPQSQGVPSTRPSPMVSDISHRVPQITQAESQEKWEKFKAQFGKNLVPVFSQDNWLVSIQGEPGKGTLDPSFKPSDRSKVEARSQLVLAALSDLIGQRADWPIEMINVRPGEVSGQAFFKETFEGLPVKPVGLIKVDLGPQGELLGFSSDYTSRVKSVHSEVLSDEEAQDKARVVLDKAKLPSLEFGGAKTVWVEGHRATYAYDYWVQGRELVIDAHTGETLLFKDRRIR